MRLLLDTNALIWLLEQKTASSLGPQAAMAIKTADAVYASPISVFEMRIKTMLGKLVSQPDLLNDIRLSGCLMTQYSVEAADSVTKYPELTKHDPFDRMILGQAETEGYTLMTADRVLLDLGLSFVIDARK